MKLSEHINRISCTYYFHFQRSSNFYHIWQQLNDWARYLKAISLNWTTSKTVIGLKTNPNPILRTLNTLSWFLCSRCQKMLSPPLFYAICIRRIDLFVINTKLGWLRNNSSQKSKALWYEKKLVKSLIWEQVFQNILAAIDNCFVIHIINTIYN
jgi:hypothetical protein